MLLRRPCRYRLQNFYPRFPQSGSRQAVRFCRLNYLSFAFRSFGPRSRRLLSVMETMLTAKPPLRTGHSGRKCRGFELYTGIEALNLGCYSSTAPFVFAFIMHGLGIGPSLLLCVAVGSMAATSFALIGRQPRYDRRNQFRQQDNGIAGGCLVICPNVSQVREYKQTLT